MTIKGESQRCLPMSFADPSIARALEQVRGLRDMLGRVHMKMEKAENALHKMCGESRPHIVPIFLRIPEFQPNTDRNGTTTQLRLVR